MSPKHYQIDDLDRRILQYLLDDSRMAYTEIAKKLLVSPGTIHVRMKKMEEAGIVRGTTLIIDTKKLGFDIVAFIGLHLSKGELFDDVIPDLEKVDEVVEAHYTTGAYGIFIKLICRNMDHMREVLKSKIQPITRVDKTETFISLEAAIDRGLKLED